MSDTITIALDAMGGDRAPGIVLRGAEIARQRYPGVRFLLFGAEGEIRPLIAKLPNLSWVVTLACVRGLVRLISSARIS